MDPIHPILPVAPNIPPVTPTPLIGRIDRDERRRGPDDEKRRRRRPDSGPVRPADAEGEDGEDPGLHINVTA